MRKGAVLLSLLWVVTLWLPAQADPRSGRTDWGPWSFHWRVGNNNEGLEIHNVRFNGVMVINKASLPVMRVKYLDDPVTDVVADCGPYQDRMKWRNMERTTCDDAKVCQRQWGDEVLELGVLSEIGEYDLYEAWYFVKSGRLEARLWGRGLSCDMDHHHHPYWRIDFDINTPANKVWRFQQSSPSVVFPDEWTEYERETNEAKATGTSDIGWWIQDSESGRFVIVRPRETRASGPANWFSNKDVGVRRYHQKEDEGWKFGATRHLGYLNDEYLWNRDIAFWFVGHLYHEAADGPDVWHSVGFTIYMAGYEPWTERREGITSLSGPIPPLKTP